MRLGTSGWNYPQWRSGFYAGVPRRRWLAHYAERFDAVEANGTFYRTLRPEVCRRWLDETPDSFRFVIKGHRLVTHRLRLRGAGRSVDFQRSAAMPLGPKLAAVLWQTSAALAYDGERLDDFLAVLAAWPEVRHVVEFRNRSWFTEEVAQRLDAAGIGTAISDAASWPLWDVVTGGVAYLRLHGHTRTYASRYSERSLARWAERVDAWRASGLSVHVYFDNDGEGHAPFDAMRLLRRLCGAGGTPELHRHGHRCREETPTQQGDER